MRSSQRTTVEIDIDVHRAIEAQRTSFEESQNEILRRLLRVGNEGVDLPDPPPSIPRTRRTGKFAFRLHGKRIEARSLKDAYLGCLRALAESEPRFLDKLGALSTRARRIVAREPEDLFLRKPELARKFAVPLCRGWWADTNLSRQQCENRLKLACDVAEITFGRDLVLEFPD